MLAIALGDPIGIGPEVALKAIAAELPRDEQRYLVIGDAELVRDLNARLKLALQIGDVSDKSTRLAVVNPLVGAESRVRDGSGDTLKREFQPAHAALAWLKHGAQLCLRGEASGLVTAPVNKEAIIRSGETSFVGQTELLSGLAGTERTAMMLLGADDRGRWLRVALATIHVPLREVAARLKQEKIESVIELAAQACRDLGLARARVAVCGLNPHAGEGGNMGDEEITIISPAVESAKGRGLDVHGPFAADALFYNVFRGDYDAVVAMYHDQGLVPLKMIGFETGVNWTLGLPFIRTSPDHGTAYDIAGKGIASPSSMVAAIRLAKQLAKNRVSAPSRQPRD
jgi:4-hydroxythreonine-4-phosphate dehydrogenase